MIWLFEHPQESFVQKGCGLQGVTRTFASKIFRRQAA
jgi:hypothetical protein